MRAPLILAGETAIDRGGRFKGVRTVLFDDPAQERATWLLPNRRGCVDRVA